MADDIRLPPLHPQLKAALDAERELLNALPQPLAAQIPALRLSVRADWPRTAEARQLRKTLMQWRQDIVHRQEGLRELEDYAQRVYGVTRPTSAIEKPAVSAAPIAAPAVAVPTVNGRKDEPPEETAPRRTAGRTPKYNWTLVGAAIAIRCLDQSARLSVPTNEAKLAAAVLEWCELKFGKQPSLTEVRAAVKTVCAELRKSSESPGKKPSR